VKDDMRTRTIEQSRKEPCDFAYLSITETPFSSPLVDLFDDKLITNTMLVSDELILHSDKELYTPNVL
jgi:hypothetical protein